jgi:hypothetical protein
MVTAVLLGLTLVFETKESDLMQRPPRDPKKPLLTFPLLMRTGLVALISLAGAFGLFAWEHGTEGRNLDEARAAVVNVIVMVQTVYLLNCRSRTRSALSASLFSNRWMLAGIVATWLAQLLFTYLPFMNRLFHSAPVRAEAWLYIVAIGVFTFAVVEFEKWLPFASFLLQKPRPQNRRNLIRHEALRSRIWVLGSNGAKKSGRSPRTGSGTCFGWHPSPRAERNRNALASPLKSFLPRFALVVRRRLPGSSRYKRPDCLHIERYVPATVAILLVWSIADCSRIWPRSWTP